MQKISRMSADGQRSVWMGAVGLVAWGEHEKFKKNSKNSKKYQYLETQDHCAKISLILGWPKNRTERAIIIILNGSGMHKACV